MIPEPAPDSTNPTMSVGSEDIKTIVTTAVSTAVKDLGDHNQLGVNAVSVKLPDFWTDSPEVWFARVEAQFGNKAITQDETKYNYVVSALDNATAKEVQSVLTRPPEDEKYVALKEALVKAFGKTQAQKDAELLGLCGLGDMKPTALLRKMDSLNSDPATIYRALFLSQLPTEVRSVLASHEITDLQELAQTADRIVEARGSNSHVIDNSN